MTCTENAENCAGQDEPVKKLDVCPTCGSDDVGHSKHTNWAGEVLAYYTYCADCGETWDVT